MHKNGCLLQHCFKSCANKQNLLSTVLLVGSSVAARAGISEEKDRFSGYEGIPTHQCSSFFREI